MYEVYISIINQYYYQNLKAMNQKFLKNAWLRVGMIAAVMTTAFVGTSRAEDITVSPTSITATSGALDDFVTYSSTESRVSNNTINLSSSSSTFTVALTENAVSLGSKIKSVSFNTNRETANYNVDGGSQQSVSVSQNTCTVSNLDCNSIVFSFGYSRTTISSIEVTYTVPTLPYTLNVTANEAEWGTIESVVGNIITAKPAVGYQFANPAYSVEGTATVSQDGNKFYVTGAANGSTVNVTINFDRSSVAPSFEVDFETNDLTSYDSWVFNNFEITNYPKYEGDYVGQAKNGTNATITTVAKIDNPGTLTFYARGSSYGDVTWSVYVSADGSDWGTAVSSTSVGNTEYKEIKVDLSSYTKVYVRIAASGASFGKIDNINLTTLASLFKVSVGSVGYSTFCSDRALDFSDSDIKVFYATASGTTLTFHQITKLPANTGVLLYKESGITDDEIPVFTGTPDAVTGNVFVRGTGAAVSYDEENEQYNYILFNGEDGIGFYKAKNNKVATNRAYIHLTSITGVKSFGIDLDNATAIKTIDNGQQTTEGAIYNVAGQRLQKMQKGINIVNGKKILF